MCHAARDPCIHVDAAMATVLAALMIVARTVNFVVATVVKYEVHALLYRMLCIDLRAFGG